MVLPPPSLDKMDFYTKSRSKAVLNLGVYLSDLSYLISYDRTQESLNYIVASQKLGESIGVASTFDLESLRRFERNLNNRDSLLSLVDELSVDVQSRLLEFNQADLSKLLRVGYFIEPYKAGKIPRRQSFP